MTKVAHFWEDDAECLYKTGASAKQLIKRNGLKVFAFHPIHVFLNTEDLKRYDASREVHSNSDQLIGHRFNGNGTRTVLTDLLNEYSNAI